MSQLNCLMTCDSNKKNVDSVSIESRQKNIFINNSNKLNLSDVTASATDDVDKSQAREFSLNFMHDPKTSIFYDQYSTLVTVDNEEYDSKSNININTNALFVEINKLSNTLPVKQLNANTHLTENQNLIVSPQEYHQKRKASLMPLLTEEDLISSNIGHKDPTLVAQVFGEDFASKFCNEPSSYSSFLRASSKSPNNTTQDVEREHSPLPYDSMEKMVMPEIRPESTLLSFEMRDSNLPK